ncbi:exodeoxyribonuclease V subunit gamma [Azomonas macrocytogenes]|uniref:RecBCD enzyme subunit RecC n=1 Tax=Azomonas macrocytogenes TaxID=69962 RepID=A0A839T5U7_AZOMA|nr:exodeoxyribonuclease V subunit gamma [Azomonas macrocytogenes]MBB3103856.1 exodeoxyribonuclease V gamma subunit [Azomonas macrocytogenes]
MLSLYHAPDLETLGELATALLGQPQRDPFAPMQVVVPSHGMGRWLTLQLARSQGIAMQLELLLPARYIWDLSRLVLGKLPEQSAFAPATLTWRLYGWLAEPDNLPRTPRLARYLDGGDERRRLSLAAKIADVFDQYLLYRDDWLAAWERGELLDLGPDEAWQALLWHELTKDGHPHRARLLGDLLARLFSDKPIAGLPERLLVFGISSLPPHHLRVLEGLARHTEVVICALNPSREAWGEIRDIRELARENDTAGGPDDWYLEVGNPLLASLGKQGRDFFDNLFALLAEGGQDIGLYSEDEDLCDDSLLRALQNDILRLRTRLPEERIALREDDRSLEVHVAHSPLREVEILHDQLLARFAADPTLSPDQVVVLTPDIEAYAPFIEAVFSARGAISAGTARIPFSLADRSLRAETPLIEIFLELLALPNSRFAAEELLAWLQQPAIARRAGIDAADLPLLRDWLHIAGVRWGRDDAHRARLGLPADGAFTWRQGLDRLLLGFAAPPQLSAQAAPLLGEHWPLDALEGSRAQVLGRLVEFVERLGVLADQLARPRPLAAWADSLQALLEQLFDEREAGDTLLQLTQACTALREQASASGLTRAVPLELVRQQLAGALEQGGGAVGFLTGAVTFCTMVPMRSLPFRLVCLLGLDDGVFPRRTPAAGFDLVARHPRRGDRARRLDDRYLLLETLLSARDALYLSYVGRDPRDNASLPPSVLVNEVLEAVDLTVAAVPGQPGPSQRIIITHPLQPFAPGNFADGRHAGFSACWFEAAGRLAEPPVAPAPFASTLDAPGEDWLNLEPAQLIRYLKHPARFFLEQRLGLYLPDAQEAIAADEPFELEPPAGRALRQLALDTMERGWSDDEERRLALAAGWLPPGELGQALWGRQRGPVRAFAPRLFEARPTQAPQPLLVDIRRAGVQIHGWLDGVTPTGLFGWKLTQPSEWDLIPFWLRHLLLNLAAPADIRCESRLLAPGGDWRLGPLENAAELLDAWLDAYRSALCEPLPLFPKTSHAFAKAICQPSTRSQKDPLQAARDKARSTWEGNEHFTGDGQDPWNALAFRDQDVLTERFEALARRLLGPAIEQLAKEETE